MSEKELRNKIIEIAFSYVGKKEISGNRGFEDKIFENKMKSVGWRPTQPWCAYFTKIVWLEAYKDYPKAVSFLEKIITGSTQLNFNNFVKNKFKVKQKDPEPGDIVIWQSKNNPNLGHTGIVIKKIDENTFQTIEGNTNEVGGREGEVVAIKTRKLNEKIYNLRGFISPSIEILKI